MYYKTAVVGQIQNLSRTDDFCSSSGSQGDLIDSTKLNNEIYVRKNLLSFLPFKIEESDNCDPLEFSYSKKVENDMIWYLQLPNQPLQKPCYFKLHNKTPKIPAASLTARTKSLYSPCPPNYLTKVPKWPFSSDCLINLPKCPLSSNCLTNLEKYPLLPNCPVTLPKFPLPQLKRFKIRNKYAIRNCHQV